MKDHHLNPVIINQPQEGLQIKHLFKGRKRKWQNKDRVKILYKHDFLY